MNVWLKDQPLLQKVAKILQRHQIEAYLVGGAVRDVLLAREDIVDLDFAVPKDGLAAARYVANALGAAFYPLDPARGTGRVVYEITKGDRIEKNHLDFATFRGSTLLEDLTDRDFTINAIALSLADPPELIDPLHGQHDLEQQQIQIVSETAFTNDPARILRAIRQAITFNFSIESQTEQYLRQAASKITTISPERQRDELVRLLNTSNPGRGIQMSHQFGVLSYLLPEVEHLIGVEQSAPHYLDVFDHTLKALTEWSHLRQTSFSEIPITFPTDLEEYFDQMLAGDLSLQQLMPLAILLHDTGKPLTRSIDEENNARIRFLGHEKESAKIVRQIMHRYRFSGQSSNFVEKVVAHHMRPLLLTSAATMSRRAIYRFFRETGGKGFEAGLAVALHAIADHRATYAPGTGQQAGERLWQVIDKLITVYFAQRDQVIDPPPLLTGQDLIKVLDLDEGRLIGVLLNRLKEAQATGQINNRAEALDFIQADPDFINYHTRKS